MSYHPPLEPWDISTIQSDGRLFVFLGPHGSGKSTCMCFVAQYMDMVHDWIAYSPTMDGNEGIRNTVLKAFRYSRAPTEKDLEFIIMKGRAERRMKRKYPDYEMRKTGLIIDDCGSDKKLMRNSKALKEIIMNQRHYGIYLFITIQYIRQLDPETYTNVDYLFCLPSDDPTDVEKLHASFFRGKLKVDARTHRKQHELERLNYYMTSYGSPGCTLLANRHSKGQPYLSYFTWDLNDELQYVGDEEMYDAHLAIMGDREDSSEEDEDVELTLERITRDRMNKALK